MTDDDGDRSLDALVVGDAMVDVVVEVLDARAHGSDTPSRVATAPGGSGANHAVWLARAGLTVGLAATVGIDPLGTAVREALIAEGVDVASVSTVDAPTGTVVALVEPDGERTMLTDRGANRSLSRSIVEGALARLLPRGHVHVSGYVLLDEVTRDAGAGALQSAATRGATRSVDASSTGPLRAAGPAELLRLAAGVERFFCNLDEGRALTELESPLAVLKALGERFGEVVVTLGADGALAVGHDGIARRDAAQARLTDTVGAGDALTATYLGERLRGAAIPAALAAGGRAAALALRTRGAREWPGYSRT